MFILDPHDWCPACERQVATWISKRRGFGEGGTRIEDHCPQCDRLAPKHTDIYFAIPGLVVGVGLFYWLARAVMGQWVADPQRLALASAWASIVGGLLVAEVVLVARREWVYRNRPRAGKP